MPRKLKLDALRTELAQLDNLLLDSEKYDDIVGKLQYQYRKNLLEQEVSELGDYNDVSASIAIFFGGDPVIGSTGIESDFAGKALQNFQSIVSRIFANSNIGNLGSRGKIPGESDATLLITNISRGSFGFVLDEVSDQMEIFDTKLKDAVDFAVNAIVGSSAEDDSRFDSVVENLDRRTFAALKKFIHELDTNGATMRLVDDKKEYSLNSPAVRRARERIEATEINENTTEISGKLIGVLSGLKKFELQLEDDSMIDGSADPMAIDTYVKRLEANKPTAGENCKLSVIKRTVKPVNRQERTFYRLLKFLEIGDETIETRPTRSNPVE